MPRCTVRLRPQTSQTQTAQIPQTAQVPKTTQIPQTTQASQTAQDATINRCHKFQGRNLAKHHNSIRMPQFSQVPQITQPTMKPAELCNSFISSNPDTGAECKQWTQTSAPSGNKSAQSCQESDSEGSNVLAGSNKCNQAKA